MYSLSIKSGTNICPENCNGKGICTEGRCVCSEGSGGVSCDRTITSFVIDKELPMTILQQEIIFFTITKEQIIEGYQLTIVILSGNIDINFATTKDIILPSNHHSEKVVNLENGKTYVMNLKTEIESFPNQEYTTLALCMI